MHFATFSQPGAGISAIFIAAMAYASTATSAIVIVTIAITLTNLTTTGPATSLVELVPKFSGVLMGLANFACNITGFITPEVVGALTVHGVGTVICPQLPVISH